MKYDVPGINNTTASHAHAALGLLHPHWTMEERVRGILNEGRSLMARMNRLTFVALVATLLAVGMVVGIVRLEAAGEPKPKPQPRKPVSRSRPVMRVDFPADRPENRKVLDVLEKKIVSVSFDEQPVKDALTFLQTLGEINIVLDRAKLEDPDQTVTLKVKDVPVGTVIKLLTEQISLHYVVRDGIVFISDEEGVRQYPLTAVYDVRDLLKPRKGLDVPAGDRSTRAARDDLIKTIQQTVDPGTWDAGSGYAIGERMIGGHLVITHTPDTLKKVQELLDSLRRARVLEEAETEAYAVGDLLVSPGKVSTTDFRRDPEVARKMTDLVTLIQEVIEPGLWNPEDGAPPRIRGNSEVLVVTHTPEIQAKVMKLLEDLRQTRKGEASAEPRPNK